MFAVARLTRILLHRRTMSTYANGATNGFVNGSAGGPGPYTLTALSRWSIATKTLPGEFLKPCGPTSLPQAGAANSRL